MANLRSGLDSFYLFVLLPSERVRRAKRRAMLQRATQVGNTQQQEDDVYDVEDAE
jgi:hypothetical protein